MGRRADIIDIDHETPVVVMMTLIHNVGMMGSRVAMSKLLCDRHKYGLKQALTVSDDDSTQALEFRCSDCGYRVLITREHFWGKK